MGLFNFGSQFTGLALADFLLGDVNTFTQGNPAIETQRPTYFGLYAQDSWKVSPRLNVSLGLRWEPLFPVTTKSGFVSHFDPAMFAANQHQVRYFRKRRPGLPTQATLASLARRIISVT